MNNKSANRQMHKQSQHRLKPVYAAVLLAFAVQTAQANPTGENVVNGQASFATSGNTLTVTNTPGTIINWQGFSISTNETTRFAQQSASSAVLNRVVGSDPSSILGTLQSNGRVFLINPNGILFGAGAVVDVAGLVASTLNLSDADFLAGNSHFTAVPGAGNISNAGNITAHGDGQGGGQIFLIAPNVENTGVITAPNGEILLAAGYSVDLVNTNNPNLRVSITAPAGDATNVGQLIASSGSLGLFGTVVRNSGTVSADSATMQGGKIVFKASQLAEVGGTVSATSTANSSPLAGEGQGRGGEIQILGNQVAVLGNIDASGTNGGGTVLIGGDAHGTNPDVQNAQYTYVDSNATIKADGFVPSPSGGGLGWGNGGKVVVWADKVTQFNGNISARGGAQSGDGGWVETSGKQTLGFVGLVDTTAAHGKTGSLLLDPTDITISAAANTMLINTLTMVWNGATFSDVTTTPSNLNVTTLVTQLGLSNVTVDTTSALKGTGNITVMDSIAWTSANSLTLNATGAGAILVNGNTTAIRAVIPLSINASGGGSLVMQTAGGSIGIFANGGVNITGGGAFTANAGGVASDVLINSAINTGAGAVNLTTSGALAINSPITAAAITVLGATGVTLGAAGTLTSSAAGNGIVLNTGTGNFINNAGAAALTANGGGRWLIYSVSPSFDTFGGLLSGNLALWGKTYATYPPGSVIETGNRYLFALNPSPVINEIVGFGKRILQIPVGVLAVNTLTTGDGGNTQELPMCN
jgi:filamentous hemagglutinin family protein